MVFSSPLDSLSATFLLAAIPCPDPNNSKKSVTSKIPKISAIKMAISNKTENQKDRRKKAAITDMKR